MKVKKKRIKVKKINNHIRCVQKGQYVETDKESSEDRKGDTDDIETRQANRS